MDDYFLPYHGGSLAGCFIEEEPRDPTPTGILTANGNMIFRLNPPKPKFGFPINADDNIGYDFDTENDYMYVEG